MCLCVSHYSSGAILKNLGVTGKAVGLIDEYAKLGKFSEFLAQNPIGRSIIRATKGAMDGYYISTTHTGKPSIGEAAGFATVETGIPAVGAVTKRGLGYITPELTSATSKLYTKLGNLYGASFILDYNKIAQHQLGVDIKDPLLRRLNETNHKVLNDFSKEFYGQNYSVLPSAQKKEVNKEINKAIANGFRYPALYDTKSTAVEVEKELDRLASKSPETKAAVDGLRAMTEKTTGKKTMKGIIERVQKETAIAKGDTPASKAEEISRIGQKRLPTKGVKTKATPQRNIPPGPGAATRYSPEFTDETIARAISLNPVLEKEEDHETLQYWKATHGKISPNVARKIISHYESNYGPKLREAKVEGLVEHLDKLFKTEHLTEKMPKRSHVFRSGTYLTDKYRKQYGPEKTIPQIKLDIEHELLTAKGERRQELLNDYRDLVEDQISEGRNPKKIRRRP